MDADGLSKPDRSHRAGKRAGRRPRGVHAIERDGTWHAHGRVLIGGRSVRVRKSLGLPVASTAFQTAQAEADAIVADLKAVAAGGVRRGDPVAIAADAYLGRTRKRPLRPTTIRIIKEAVAQFGPRRLNEIAPSEWQDWIDGSNGKPGRMTGRSASSRERFLSGVLGFLSFARRQHGLAALPAFERDKAARNPNRRARRRVQDLRPELIERLLRSAHIAIQAQLAVERATGARVSSLLYGARLCDLVLGKKRALITFRGTKNGEDVSAALDASTVAILKAYLKWRGRLHDREAPLFLTPARKPYADNGGDGGGQNKTGFKAARRRAIAALLADAETEAAKLPRKAAAALRERATADAALLGKVTQHWFRHLLATRWLRKDLRAAMEQGGWLDVRSVIGYSHDAPEYRHQIAAEFDDLDTSWTREPEEKTR